MKKYRIKWMLEAGKEVVDAVIPVLQEKLKNGPCEIKEIAEAFDLNSEGVTGIITDAFQHPNALYSLVINEESTCPQTFFWNAFMRKFCKGQDEWFINFDLWAEDNSICISNIIFYKNKYHIKGWEEYDDLRNLLPYDLPSDISEYDLKDLLDKIFDKCDGLEIQIKKLTDKYPKVSVCEWIVDQVCELTPYVPY